MIAGMSYYQILWYFVIYSFLGWTVEVIFHAVSLGKVINRGFLNGPVCPVYGFGVLSVFSLFSSVAHEGAADINPALLFIFGTILATLVELIAGWLLNTLFHARWWDYSNRPFNFHGYICLQFSIIWGIAIVLVVDVLHPYIQRTSSSLIPEKYGWPVLAVIYILYLADLIVTVLIVTNMNRRLAELDEIKKSMRIVSDGLSEVLADTSIRTSQVIGESRVQASLARAELRDAVSQKKAELSEAASVRKAELTAAVSGKKEEMAGLVSSATGKVSELASSASGKVTELASSASGKVTGLASSASGKMTELASSASGKVTGLASSASDKGSDLASSASDKYAQLQKKYDALLSSLLKNRFFGASRILRAFPDLRSRDYREVLQSLKDRLRR